MGSEVGDDVGFALVVWVGFGFSVSEALFAGGSVFKEAAGDSVLSLKLPGMEQEYKEIIITAVIMTEHIFFTLSYYYLIRMEARIRISY